jgi:hypothetical protein
MRKARLAVVTALAVFGIAAVAFASTNTYTVTGSVSPSKAGTKAKPAPVSIKYDVEIAGANGNRPSPLTAITLTVGDGVINQKVVPGCTASQAATDSCTKSLIGTANVSAIAGPASDPSQKPLPCALPAKVYNGPTGHAFIHVKGAPPACAISIDQLINASFKRVGKNLVLSFSIPDLLVHPLGSSSDVETGTTSIKGTFKKITKKIKGKKTGFLATTACPGGKHAVSVKLTTLAGADSAATSVKCSK